MKTSKRILLLSLAFVMMLAAGCSNSIDSANGENIEQVNKMYPNEQMQSPPQNMQEGQPPMNHQDGEMPPQNGERLQGQGQPPQNGERPTNGEQQNPLDNMDMPTDSNQQGPPDDSMGMPTGSSQQEPPDDSMEMPSDSNQQDASSGEQSGRGPGFSTLSVDEANAMEEQLLADVGYYAEVGGYPIVDTNTTKYYDNDGTISKPSEGSSFYGQDANYTTNECSYTDNDDGTVTDNVTGLMWQQDPGEKMNWEEAVENLKNFNLGGYDDWRLPTIKELYSLVQFSGQLTMNGDKIPFLDTDYFEFSYGDTSIGERDIDSQMLSSTIYDTYTMQGNSTVFGFNFADGRIKGYSTGMDFYVYYVRGDETYGQNMLIDNGDGTITDLATGLMWMTYDSGYYSAGDAGDGTMDWEDALEWCEDMEFAGYDDWKLPDAKELQSIVDYTRSPDTTDSAAIDVMFYSTPIISAFGENDYAFYWSSTTHLDGIVYGGNAVYIAFGRGNGMMNGDELDVHGAGCQRSDKKTGDRDDYPYINEDAPQGDEQRVYNMVRAVRVISDN